MADSIHVFIVEKERTARRFLKKLGYSKSLDDLVLFPLNKHTTPDAIAAYLKPLLEGTDVGLLSEAGCPAVADPGSQVVALAHQHSIRVVPLTGPSSLLLALMASGMNGQSFVFHGYLPRDSHNRINRIRALEGAAQKGQTQLFIETPYRNEQLLRDLLASCRASTRLCIAADITLQSEQIQTRSIAEWKEKPPALNKRPVVFLLAGSS
jgi:16S rRNA (cytidine1402-2'-O)-methyltransferase